MLFVGNIYCYFFFAEALFVLFLVNDDHQIPEENYHLHCVCVVLLFLGHALNCVCFYIS